jgi:hypothetical protein
MVRLVPITLPIARFTSPQVGIGEKVQGNGWNCRRGLLGNMSVLSTRPFTSGLLSRLIEGDEWDMVTLR